MSILPPELITIVCDYLHSNKGALVQLCQVNHIYKNTVYNTCPYQIFYLSKDPTYCYLLYGREFHCLCSNTKCKRILKYYCITKHRYVCHLASLCRFGHLEVAQWLNRYIGNVPYVDLIHCLYGACASHLEMVQWVVETFKIHVKKIRYNGNRALRIASINGHLDIVKWLVETFDLNAKDARDFQCIGEGSLPMACRNGHLEVAQWLVKTFNFDVNDITNIDNHRCNSVLLACKGGHIKVAQWLVETFNLNAEDVYGYSYSALRSACGNGHLEIVKWLCKTFNLGIEDLRYKSMFTEHGLYYACSGNHLEIAKWLHSNFNLMNENESIYTLSLYDACEQGNLDVAKWVYTTFNLTPEHAQYDNNKPLRKALKRNHQDMVKWLLSILNLT